MHSSIHTTEYYTINPKPKPNMSIIPSFFTRRSLQAKSTPSTNNQPLSIDIRDPFEAFTFAATAPAVAAFSSSMDWKETPEAHVFITDLPGVKKEEVKVEVEEEKVLRISGQRSVERDEHTDMWHHVERSTDRFVRTVRLPRGTDVDSAKAQLENGVLTVIVPKYKELAVNGKGVGNARLIPVN